MAERRGNYAVMPERGRQLFLNYDQEALIRRLELPHTQEFIFVRFLGDEYRIRRSDGQVLEPGGEPAGFSEVMSIYDMLCHQPERPVLSGQFAPTTALHGIQGTHSVHESFGGPAADFFNVHQDGLRRACEALGGVSSAPGDICYVLPVFDFFPCCVRFWEADEEFPAGWQILWDTHACDFVFYETLFYMMGALTEKLMEMIKKEA